VYKRFGKATTEDEAFHLLDHLGDISNIEPLDEVVLQEMELPPAMVVHFKMYDSRRDVMRVSLNTKCDIETN
jgi:hypothetical protein